MTKKIIKIVCASIGSILLSALIAFGIFTLIRNKNVAETGNVLGVSWYNETDSVFTITTAEELYEFAELSKFYNFKGQMIKLGADIVVNEGHAADWAENAPEKKWKPINRFAGTFDGQGHTISGLYAKVFGAKLAMFTNTVQTCSIKNLSLVNTYFESNGLEGLASFVSTGGGKFYKLYSDAILECSGEQVGGLASMINKASKFEECWFDGSIHTTNRDAGGLIDEIANVRVDMKHCLFSGTLEQEYTIGGTRTGAICGRVRDKGSLIMDDCLASGTLTADKTIYTGALVGVVYSGCQIATTNSYVSSDTYHLMVGDSGEQGVINGKPLHLMSDVLIGTKAFEWTTLDFDKYWAAVEGGTPVLKCFGEQGLSLAGVEKAFDISWYQPGTYTYELTTLKQLYGFYILSGGNNFAEHTIKLGADIVVNEGKVADWEKSAPKNPWFAINKFAGMFDGQGHTISGIYLKNQMTYQGLFAQVEPTGIVKNFSLKNSYFCNDSDGKLAMMGSIAGEFRGKLENVYSDAIVVSYGTQVGGIFGRTNDNDSDGKEDKVLITNCWFDGELRMKGQGGRYGGGFVGMVVQGDLDIIHSLNTGICSAEAINTGVHLGGFVGQTMNKGVINMTDCLSAGEIEVAYRICVGSVFGRATNEERTVNLSNVYATKEGYDVTFFGTGEGGSTTAAIKGGVIPIPEKMVIGFKAYQWTDLDFANHWAVVQDGTPILKAFAKSVPSLAGQKKMIDLKWYKADKKSYVLKTAEELCGFALVSGGDSFKGKTVKLGADIVVNQGQASGYATNAPKVDWLPIGNSITYFQGVFDGQGHTISGLYLNTEDTWSGLFGITGAESVLKNFRLTNSYFCYSGTSAAVLGSVAGELNGGATLKNVYSNAVVVSHGGQAGGLVGRINDKDTDKDEKTDKAVIQNCWYDGEFSLKGEKTQYGGGLVGRIFRGDLDMSHCLNTGSVSSEATGTSLQLGGLIGAVNDVGTLNLTDSLNIGTLIVDANNGVGSIIGRTSCNEDNDRVINMEGTYTLLSSHMNLIGSVSNSQVNGGPIPLAEELLTGYQAYQWTALDFVDYWAVVETGTPILKQFASSVPSIAGYKKMFNLDWYKADADVYEIRTADELRGFALLAGGNSFKGKTVKLKADNIDLKETGWIPIGSSMAQFQGTFEGNGHTIKGVNLDTKEYYGGLFGIIGAGSVVKNFRLADSTLTYSGTGSAILGSVVGEMYGAATLENIYSDATVVSHGSQAGGLVGRINDNDTDKKEDKALIQNCWFDGSFSMKGEKTQYGGGLVGRVFRGDLDMSHCLNTGKVSSEAKDTSLQLGGLIGAVHDVGTLNLADSLNIGTISVSSNNGVGSIFGRVTGTEAQDRVVNIEKTYARANSHKALIGSKENEDINGGVIPLPEDLLTGYKAYQWTELDFSDSWTVVEDDTPVLKEFASKVPSLLGYKKMFDLDWYEADEKAYEIKTADELRGFALISGVDNFDGKKITLNARNNEIDLKDEDWLPIGSSFAAFAGRFDGKMHTISGINLNTSTAGAGFFGEIGTAGSVSNLYITDSTFKSTATDLGSVAGINRGNISTVYSDADIISNQLRSGGIVGSMLGSASVDNCWFDGTITLTTANGKQSGGIVGYIGYNTKNTGVSITDCLYTGELTFEATSKKWGLRIGGIAGGAHDYYTPTITIENCVSAGTMKQTAGSKDIVAVSAVYGGFDEPRVTTLNLVNVYGTKECCAVDRVYHQYRADANAAGTDPIITETEVLLLDEVALQGTLGYQLTDLDFKNIWAARSEDVPALQKFVESPLDLADVIKADTSWYKTGETRQEISNEAEMYGFMKLMAEGNTFAGKEVYLMVDLDKMNKVTTDTIDKWKAGTEASVSQWIGATKFAGTFDGQMHTISGIYLNTTIAGCGLFGEITATGVVKNLYIKDSLFMSTATDVGSVAGLNRGTISTVYSNADIVSSQLHTGGIVGSMLGKASVDTCWFDGNMSLTTANGKQAGGIVGYIAQGTKDTNVNIIDCLYTGDLTFEATSTKWGLRIGGIVGGAHDYYTPTITIENCISAGTMKQKDGSKNIVAVSTVYGGFDELRSTTLKLTNVYGTNECCAEDRIYHQYKADVNATGVDPIITGTGVMLDESALQGVSGYQNTNLDFTNTWAARSKEVPGLKVFTKIVSSSLDLTKVVRPDTGWYKPNETRQEILDEADMYGFMKLMAEGNTFAEKEIYLMADLNKMNEVKADTINKWAAGTETPDNKWVGGTKFAGTFDGQMHTISGVYLNTTATKGGLFGEITATGVVKNLYIEDSLFKSTAGTIGSVAGISYGTISTVYSNADVISSQTMSGGIVGNMKDTASVDTCWYAGDMKLSTKNGKQAGGIVGYIDKGAENINVSIVDCLYTGNITFEASDATWALRIGGIVGGAHDYRVPTINLENCVSAGTITQSPSSANHLGVSAVYGGLDGAQATALNFVNVYSIKGCFVEERIYDKKVNGPKVTGTGLFKEKSDLEGVKGYQNTLLDFEDTWVARKDNVPAPKAFTKVIGETVAITGVEQNSWYNASETVFGIGSASALKSLATYTDVTNKISFKDKTIYLLDDIEINKVEEGTLAAWKAGTETLPTSWAPIGVGEAFNGTFDGRMHTISGIYLNSTSTNTSRWTGFGMFARTGYNSTVRNFSLVDSYFAVDKNGGNANGSGYISNLGSIVGYHHGYLNNVYSNATIASNRRQVGGIMGYSNSRGVSNVWFDGTISVSSAHGREVGGIVGVMDSNNTFENILFTGEITHNADRADMGIGGIIGITYASSACTPTLKNVIAAGKITKGKWGGNQAVGSMVGLIYKATVKTENVYATSDLWNVTYNIASGGTGTLSGSIKKVTEADLYGDLAKTSAAALDYVNTWVTRTGKVPALKKFVE